MKKALKVKFNPMKQLLKLLKKTKVTLKKINQPPILKQLKKKNCFC